MTPPIDIAIIGMSCIFPGAGTVDDFWNNIKNKVDAIRPASPARLDPVYFAGDRRGGDPQPGTGPTGDPDNFYCNRGGFIDEFATFDPAQFGILPLAVEGTEPEQLLALSLAHRSLTDAGLFERGPLPAKTGIIIGKGNYAGPGVLRAIEIIHTGQQLVALLKDLMPGIREEETERIKKEFQQKKGRYAPDTVMGLIPNLVASLIANRLDLGGPAYTVDAACASSLIAIDHAVKELSLGNADLMIAGGVHASQNATFWSVFTQLGALSKTQQIRPFDRKADGLLIGEGCGFVVLKRLDEAIRDQHRIYAVIKGVGVSSDGAGASVMSPSVHGQSKAILQAWSNARLHTSAIGYIEAHGTGTPLGDRIELETLAGIFGANRPQDRPHGLRAGIGSVKSNIGHAMPAAGIAGLIKTALALYHNLLPPTLHCDEPLEMMNHSGFEPVRETLDWDSTGLPKIAGVNAFGFGGINAHVVLESFDGDRSTGKTASFSTIHSRDNIPAAETMDEKVLLLTAKDKGSLIRALDREVQPAGIPQTADNPHSNTGDRYRIAIFDPTPARIRMAIKIVGKDRPWRNKMDIWFSNEAFLSDGKKIAFLFPGLDGLTGGEIDTVARHFHLPLPDPEPPAEAGVLDSALRLAERTHILYTALRKLDVSPHLHAGHSLGEWLAGYAAGWGEENDVIALMQQLDPRLFEQDNIAFLMVGCSYGELQPLLSSLENVHLSNDNCPRQVILCGDEASIHQLIGRLREKQVFHQLLPFRSGFHSPFMEDKIPLLREAYKNLRFKSPGIPLWSATTIQEYPATHDEICALGIRHLLEPVRFRELTEKLYREGVRIFIQVGSGGLIGFIDDTLKGESYSAVPANSATRCGLAQLRRVLAALFAEGRQDVSALLAPPMAAPKRTAAVRPMQLKLGTPLVKKLDSFQEISGRLLTARGQPSGDHHPAVPSSPILAALLDNHRQMEQVQSEIIGLFHRQSGTASSAPPRRISHRLDISLDNHPYLIDHSLFRQPPGWECVEDKNPVIPMTMILEVFSEIAEAHIPGAVVRGLANIQVLQWMSVATPFRETVTGEWLAPGKWGMTLDKFAGAEIVLGDDVTLPAALDAGASSFTSFDIGAPLPVHITPDEIYQQYMFHEPAYRGIRQVVRIAEKGITGLIESSTGKGSLLDNAGQLFGFWLQLILPREKVAFPVKIREILFYEDRIAQAGLFECTCLLTQLTDESATADFLIKKEGKPWALVRGWQDRRLELDDRFWKLAYAPLRHFLSEEIAPGIFFFHHAYNRVLSWDFVAKRYFSLPEREYASSLPPKRKKEWTISRIAAKDAIRALLAREKGQQYYPIELSIRSDEKGRPYPQGKGVEDIGVSLAHKGTDAVAIASSMGPVGIDIEAIEDRGEGFAGLALHPEEKALITGRDGPEWITRCWVAKEAYGKWLGLGLQGSPLRYRITDISGEDLRIGNVVITTFKHKNYIIGWTH
jgi:acyl transferase domain-containing protein/phosphopantetheinyl transferase